MWQQTAHHRFVVFIFTVSLTCPFAVAQATTQPSVIGIYKAQHGDPAKDSFASTMMLELKADGSMNSTLTMADPKNPNKTTEKKVEGTWTQAGDTIHIAADKLDGKPVETNNPRKSLTLTITEGGKTLTSNGGPQFIRQ